MASVSFAENAITVTSADGSNYGNGSPVGVPDPATGPTWQVAINDGTGFEGVAGLSQLTVGMPVDMDLTVQANGALMATRIAVSDTDTISLSLWNGPLLMIHSDGPYLAFLPREQIGPILSGMTAPSITKTRFWHLRATGQSRELTFRGEFHWLQYGRRAECRDHASRVSLVR